MVPAKKKKEKITKETIYTAVSPLAFSLLNFNMIYPNKC